MEISQIESTSQPEICQLGRERVIRRARLSLSNAVRVDKARKSSHRLSLSLSPSFQTDVATYRATYGLLTLSVISLCMHNVLDSLKNLRFGFHMS